MISHLKIKAKINLIMMVGALGLAVLATVFFTSKTRESKATAKKDEAFEVYRVVERLNENLLQARRREKDFIIRKDEKYIGTHAEIMTRVKADLVDLKDHDFDEKTTETLLELELDVQKYDEQFTAVVNLYKETGLSETEGFQGSLRASVHDLEERLKEVNNPQLQVQMLMMRRHEKDFIMRVAPKYRERMIATRAEFERLMGGSSLNRSTRQAFAGLVVSYHRDFEAMADAKMKIQAEVKVLSETYAIMAPVLEELRSVLTMGYDTAHEEFVAVREASSQIMLPVFIAVLLLASFTGVLVGRDMTRSVRGLSEKMNLLAEGELDVEIAGVDRRDELGLMARSTQTFKENALEMKRMRLEETERVAQEREKEAEALRLERERQQAMANHVLNFEGQVKAALEALSHAAKDMRETANNLNADADTSNNQSQTVASASDMAAKRTQTVAAAAEELSCSIGEISQMVGHSGEISTKAVGDSQLAEDRVNALSQISDQVGAIVGLIQKIAERTNLLALNASIESARAGDMGKGFAVVASEVKSLASQTAEATEDISTQIQAIKEATGEVVEVIRKVVTVIGEMSDISKSIAVGVEQQNHATSEISINIQEVATSTDEVSSNIEQVAETVSKAKTTADHLLSVSEDVSSKTRALNQDIHEFLSVVTAA